MMHQKFPGHLKRLWLLTNTKLKTGTSWTIVCCCCIFPKDKKRTVIYKPLKIIFKYLRVWNLLNGWKQSSTQCETPCASVSIISTPETTHTHTHTERVNPSSVSGMSTLLCWLYDPGAEIMRKNRREKKKKVKVKKSNKRRGRKRSFTRRWWRGGILKRREDCMEGNNVDNIQQKGEEMKRKMINGG